MTTQGIKKILANNDDQLDRLGKAIDAAVEQIDSLKADLEQALGLLEKHQYPDTNDDSPEYHRCPECLNRDGQWVGRRTTGHHADCLWANLLSKYNREVRFHDLKEAE